MRFATLTQISGGGSDCGRDRLGLDSPCLSHARHTGVNLEQVDVWIVCVPLARLFGIGASCWLEHTSIRQQNAFRLLHYFDKQAEAHEGLGLRRGNKNDFYPVAVATGTISLSGSSLSITKSSNRSNAGNENESESWSSRSRAAKSASVG